MNSEKLQQIAFELILSSGDARTLVHEAFKKMREDQFNEADEKINAANDSIVQAHKAQTGLLQSYANGDKIEMEIIMVHAQDHLMTTITLKEVAAELLLMYQKNFELVK